MLEMGVPDSGVEPCGRVVEGGREGCDRGSIVTFFAGGFFLFNGREC